MLEVAGVREQAEDCSSFSRLVAFKPRQVLLAEQNQLPRLKMMKKQAEEQLTQTTIVLKDDQKRALLHSVVKYISDKGFAKTLKRFLKEALVKDDAWKESSFDLEEIYGKYLATCGNDETKSKGIEEQGGFLNENFLNVDCLYQKESVKGMTNKDAEKVVPSGIVNKKKKKKSNENDDSTKFSVPTVKIDNSAEELKDREKKKISADKDTTIEDDGKKQKKRNKIDKNDEDLKSSVPEVEKNDSMKEPADKKKKKKKRSGLTSESHEENGALDVDITEAKEKKKKKKKDSVIEKISDNGAEVFDNEQSHATLDSETDNKSKKRKRSTSDETKETHIEAVEEFKKRKTEGPAEVEVNGEAKEDNGTGSQLKTPKPAKQFDENENENGSLINNGTGKFSEKKSAKNLRNGSAEPKTVNAFQRVKVDAVEFADERLQDNSYWAKDGAETGYGAKAQEILGQVKGRDFRHEKTKKKRGSYRGGQIDLQSHSIKFNYSDDE